MYYFNSRTKSGRAELALAAGLILALLFCVIPIKAQTQLAQKLTRLHIVANSDTIEDQELKLEVRDALIEKAGYDIDFASSEINDELLAKLQSTAQRKVQANGFDYNVSVIRTNMYFDTRVYEGFSLPAGNYDAVRVTIGEGKGKNWWCVLFPPLCLGAAEGDIEKISQAAGLTKEDIALIKQDGTTYVIKFKLMEIIGKLVNSFK